MKNNFFKNIVQWESTLNKYTGKVPVFYYNTVSMTAIFTATTSRVKKYLPHPKMQPLEIFPGKCLVAFMAFEYRETDVGPYNEFSISIPITFGNKSPIPAINILANMITKCFTAYIWHLPVTTENALVGGVEVLGYPKIVADINFKKSLKWLHCSLSENGKSIIKFKGRILPTAYGKQMTYKTYSLKNNIPIATKILINPIKFAQLPGGNSAEIKIGCGHQICEELNDVGLSKKPIVYQYSPLNQAILFFPRSIVEL